MLEWCYERIVHHADVRTELEFCKWMGELAFRPGKNRLDYCTVLERFARCVNCPLLALTVAVKDRVGVPVKTVKFTADDGPAPAAGFVPTTGSRPVLATSVVDNAIYIRVGLVKDELCVTPLCVRADQVRKFEPLMYSFRPRSEHYALGRSRKKLAGEGKSPNHFPPIDRTK